MPSICVDNDTCFTQPPAFDSKRHPTHSRLHGRYFHRRNARPQHHWHITITRYYAIRTLVHRHFIFMPQTRHSSTPAAFLSSLLFCSISNRIPAPPQATPHVTSGPHRDRRFEPPSWRFDKFFKHHQSRWDQIRRPAHSDIAGSDYDAEIVMRKQVGKHGNSTLSCYVEGTGRLSTCDDPALAERCGRAAQFNAGECGGHDRTLVLGLMEEVRVLC
ncbi:hypothetical protein BJ508DRAFT_303947 [Ascobolus immersus RN42]|uniref:Uncharacterized protein n=1 Tax=Ascobolus immersus RN42 TaxID=1160509 RepID=A0A3N4IRA6_ASCIM|nr:hypothetical protein BJ508DRAFT_303947 [Ascobolus immersus RN42]